MGHKLDSYDIKELKENMNNLDDLIFVVGCMVERAYSCGYEECYGDCLNNKNNNVSNSNSYALMDRDYNI